MAGNLLPNASFLDGVTGYGVSGLGAAVADETTFGAPGRIALAAAGAVSPGSNAFVNAPGVAVTAGQTYEFQVGLAAGDYAIVVWTNGSGNVAASTLTLGRAARAAPRRGLRSGFDWYFGRFTAPAGATSAVLQCKVGAAASGQHTFLMIKPYVGVSSGHSWPATWDPGTHANPDLQLPVWPPTLRPFQNTSGPQPVANAKAFSTDSGVPIREDLYTGLHYDLKAQVRVSPDELEDLLTFYETARGGFFVVDPFTDRLGVGEWLADGAPAFQSDEGETAIYQVGLHVTVV